MASNWIPSAGRGWRIVGGIVQIPFTHITLLLALVSCFRGINSHVYAVTTCLFWGAGASFFLAPAFDPGVYARMAAANNWSMAQFHVGNAVAHLFPALATIAFPPRAIRVSHGVCAASVHAIWGTYTSNGTMCLDVVYAPMKRYQWYELWVVAFAVEIISASLFQQMLPQAYFDLRSA